MKRKITAWVWIMVLTMTMSLTGCGQRATDRVDNSNNLSSEKNAGHASKESDDLGTDQSMLHEEGLPIVKEPVTLRIAAKKRETIVKPFEELAYIKAIEDATNVHIEWDVTPENSWKEKKNLMIASGDWPDAFWGAYVIEDSEVIKLAAEGVFMPLEDLIEEHAPNIKKLIDETPGLREYITAPDGHIYAIPSINATQNIVPSSQFINKAWLDEVGMDVPKTTEEFYEMLKAFTEIAGEGEVPFTFMYDNNVTGINGMFGSFGISDNGGKMTVVNHEVVYTPTREAYKEAIMFFHKLYEEGLLDVEAFSQNMPVYKSKLTNKTVGGASFWSLQWLFGSSWRESGYVYMPPLEGPNGDYGYTYNATAYLKGKGGFAITTVCKDPVVAMKWIDYIATPEVGHGLFRGDTMVKGEDGIYREAKIPEGMSNDEFRHAESTGANSFHQISEEFYESVEMGDGHIEKHEYDMLALEHKTNPFLPPYYLEPEDALRVAEIRGDLDTLVKEKTAIWLLEGGIEEEWEEFQKQMKQMGVEEMLEIHNTRYAAFGQSN